MWRIDSVAGFVKMWKVVDACRTIIIFVVTSQKRSLSLNPPLYHPLLHHGPRNVSVPAHPFPRSILKHPRKFYDLLEVPPTASESDLKKAYRKK
jgi:hypothetical protein